ncbi:MAG TPA: exosortase/archaeosortase family protein [Bryobacteraceae bacterium]|nr:exosortase/archaeosortase family protein [Bryobacteraceae bacterium]
MTAAQSGPESVEKTSQPFSWITIACVAALLTVCYAPVLFGLGSVWYNDADMGHGFFVPLIAGYIAWQKRSKIEGLAPRPSWWGLAVLLWGGLQLYLGTLGAELYTTRTSVVFSIAGAVLLLGGKKYLQIFWFPIFLLFFMVPIPAVVYNEITFPLQLLASRVAENAISLLGIPIIREGNVLELASQKLDVVEACSGIRSLLTLTFLSLVYGYFCEKRTWLRAVLFFSTIPIAIAANAARVTITGVLANFKPELAEGLFHEAQGWVIFMVAFAILAGLHQLLVRGAKMMEKSHELSPA